MFLHFHDIFDGVNLFDFELLPATVNIISNIFLKKYFAGNVNL